MIHCPICKSALAKQTLHGTEVDVCEQHGVWLDKSELYGITERARHKELARRN